MTKQDELKLNDYKYIISKLKPGKLFAKTYDKLYQEYKAEGGWLSKPSFTRKVRDNCENAQRDHIKLCRDSDCGLYLAETDEEWEKYRKSEQSRAGNIIKNIALCEKKTVAQVVSEWFLNVEKKKIIPLDQLTLL
jgi:hypothetical protein